MHSFACKALQEQVLVPTFLLFLLFSFMLLPRQVGALCGERVQRIVRPGKRLARGHVGWSSLRLVLWCVVVVHALLVGNHGRPARAGGRGNSQQSSAVSPGTAGDVDGCVTIGEDGHNNT